MWEMGSDRRTLPDLKATQCCLEELLAPNRTQCWTAENLAHPALSAAGNCLNALFCGEGQPRPPSLREYVEVLGPRVFVWSLQERRTFLLE